MASLTHSLSLFLTLSLSLSPLCLFFSHSLHAALLTDSFYNNTAEATDNRTDRRDQATLSLLFALRAEQRRPAIALESRRPDKQAVAMVTSGASWSACTAT